MRVRFTKMHGNGNDFILVDEFKGVVVVEERKPEFVRAVCHRYFGIGADGMLFVQKSDVADVRFRYFNSDGSEAEMCGNGIRCFSRYVVEEGYAESPLKVETLAGILELEVTRDDEGWWVRVDMGRPRLEKEEIPSLEEVWGKEFEFDGRRFRVYALNTGVPHAVIFVDDLDFNIIPAAKHIRHHSVFPEGINVNFARVIDAKTVRVRTYERGVENETLSCGTGSVAVAVVANRLGLTGRSVDVLTKGGKLKIEIADDTVYMTGQASRVADGYINTEELRYDLP
ncbi:diaminopimelate epimerase [Geoglobus ahangari]|uniref:Diaminopimelate epimerase n=1 Tax=Geoglobus ahangari TaxID=113653 RepID=A0A0F7IGI0_9EURY|nr:diaminopimelate epimerase [Geoglobus ahangari]AKG91038.1 diaminopimelate epimerase [Geoglobus ahangari]